MEAVMGRKGADRSNVASVLRFVLSCQVSLRDQGLPRTDVRLSRFFSI